MKKEILIAVALSSSLYATDANTYVKMSHMNLTHSDNGTVSDFSPTGFKWTIGQNLKEFSQVTLSLEASAMLGVTHDNKASVASSGVGTFSNASISLDRLYNVNLKGSYAVTEDFSLAGYLGASRGRMLLEATNNTPESAYENAISYGTGLEYMIGSEVSLHLDYMRYFKNLDSFEFGLGFRF